MEYDRHRRTKLIRTPKGVMEWLQKVCPDAIFCAWSNQAQKYVRVSIDLNVLENLAPRHIGGWPIQLEVARRADRRVDRYYGHGITVARTPVACHFRIQYARHIRAYCAGQFDSSGFSKLEE